MVLNAFDPRTQEAETGKCLWVGGQGSHSYTVRPCLKKQKAKPSKKKDNFNTRAMCN